jgi:hypothetical protein
MLLPFGTTLQNFESGGGLSNLSNLKSRLNLLPYLLT